MGPEGVKHCLNAGVNDLGGTLMNESITRAAGTVHGQEMLPEWMESIIHEAGGSQNKEIRFTELPELLKSKNPMDTNNLLDFTPNFL